MPANHSRCLKSSVMGVMEKLRSSTPIVLWVLIFSFGILWVLQDTQVFDVMAGGPATVGTVNGDAISLEEYNSRVSYYADQYSQQNLPNTADMRALYEEQAWEDLVAERLISQKMNELGITVSDEELVNMILGENPDPFILQQFQDEEGNLDRIALQAAVEAPENEPIWVMIEQQLRQSRQQQKLSNFIFSSLQVGGLEVERAYERANSYADIRFVRLPYSDVAESEITVTDQEISDYYNRNRDEFQRERTWHFRYVSFEKIPTREDTLRAIQDLEELADEFRETDPAELASFLIRNQSLTGYSDQFIAADDIREEYRTVLALDAGEVSDVEMIGGVPHLFRKVDERNGEVKFAVLALPVEPDPIATIDRLAEQANDFSFFAREEGFDSEAARNTMEIHSATATEGMPFVPGIGEARALLSELERMRPGSISEEIELSDRFLVVQLTDEIPAGPRPMEEVRNQIENTLRGRKRVEMTVQRAEELLRANATLDALAEAAGQEVQTAGNVRWGGATIPGAGREPGIIGAVFGLSEGERSGVLEGNNAAFVIEVDEMNRSDASEMSDEQRRQLSQEMEQLKFMLFSEVLIDQLKEDARIRDNRHRLIR